jgi:hypothetical protein
MDEPHLAHLDDFVGEVLPDVNVLGSLTSTDDVVTPLDAGAHCSLRCQNNFPGISALDFLGPAMFENCISLNGFESFPNSCLFLTSQPTGDDEFISNQLWSIDILSRQY